MVGVVNTNSVDWWMFTCWVRIYRQSSILQTQSIATLERKLDLSTIFFPYAPRRSWTKPLTSQMSRFRRLKLPTPNLPNILAGRAIGRTSPVNLQAAGLAPQTGLQSQIGSATVVDQRLPLDTPLGSHNLLSVLGKQLSTANPLQRNYHRSPCGTPTLHLVDRGRFWTFG